MSTYDNWKTSPPEYCEVCDMELRNGVCKSCKAFRESDDSDAEYDRMKDEGELHDRR